MSKMTDEEIVGLAAGFIEMTNDVYVDFMPSNLIAFARAIEARSLPANERVRDEWISVEDRLPNEQDSVLVFRPDAHHFPACDPNIDVRRYLGNEVFRGIHKVTHWMPLPAAPVRALIGKGE